jgi:outer membrane protein OmpA-like peptidoglycan-associated protein
MRLTRNIALAAAAVSAPLAALAQPVSGPYVSLSGGVNLVDTTKSLAAISPAAPFYTLNAPDTYKTGFAVIGAAGYGFDFGLRVELEGAFRGNDPNQFILTTATPSGTANYTGDEKRYSLMANAYYDIATFSGFTPYIGGGVGVTYDDWHGVTRTSLANPFFAGQLSNISNVAHDTEPRFSYQLIGGVSYAIAAVPGLSITGEYRFFGMPLPVNIKDTLVYAPVAGSAGISGTSSGYSKYSSQYNNTFLIGLRYAFGAPAPVAAPAAPISTAVPPSPVSRSYLVFFDWDKAVLTDRAKQIVGEAAAASTKVQVTKIQVNGYTDTSGTASYNQGLSMRRAETVAAELVKDGVPKSEIAIQGFGETHLLVPTGAGVREPQNRRVEIIIM